LEGQPSEKKAPKTKPGSPAVVINTDSASADFYDSGKKRAKIWTVSWKTSKTLLKNGGVKEGYMTDVTGQLFNGGAKGVTFSADSGLANQIAKTIRLDGNVTMISADKKSRLMCDSLNYDSQKKLYFADGNVRLVSPVGSIGPFPKMIANSDFTRVGTPQSFNRP
jgi:lipopolysaccharide assembly outer membrane protein LptD (OstA)